MVACKCTQIITSSINSVLQLQIQNIIIISLCILTISDSIINGFALGICPKIGPPLSSNRQYLSYACVEELR